MKRLFSPDHADAYLAIAVVAIIAAMIVPIPAWMLDALIALNLGVAATLLVGALYAREAITVASFPPLLLITTLYRLALNVSSTRLALLDAHAGAVIQAFGEFIVQGDFVVGAVVFAILSLVQFLVVAKGAERVAEVGARFTLDAMPGKQMAIDADLRSGAIDMDAARKRRSALERESQLYGAMDGAMKFVKGDAIAGLVIVLVNAVGGLVIGVLGKGMAIGAAARTYTLLAIGDGLVSQIPALCIAISAGLVVTRVSSDDEHGSLGADIGRQFMGHPKGLAIVAGLLAALGLLPMMPRIPFFALALAAGGGAYLLARRRAAAAAASRKPVEGASAAAPSRTDASAAPSAPCVGVAPICLDLDRSLEELALADDSHLVKVDLPALREELFRETGVRLPGIRVRAGATLGAFGYALLIDEVPCAHGRVDSSSCLVSGCPEEVSVLGAMGEPHTDGATGRAWTRLPAEFAPVARDAGFEVRSARESLVADVACALRRHASSFLGIHEVQSLLDALDKTHPALVREATQRVSMPLLTEVLRRLVDEGVSIRNLRAILEALAEPGTESDSLALAERCRRALRRHLSHRYAGEGTLYAHLADPELEEILREAINAAPEPGALALAPEDASAILDGVREALCGLRQGVILASPDVRRYLRKLCEGIFPEVAVLTYGELTPELRVRPIGRVCALRAQAA